MKTKSNESQGDGISRPMVQEMTVINPLGLHARPAALFVKAASAYTADVTVEKDGNVVSGKSIMGLMTLQAECGAVLRVTAQGPDAAAVLDELTQLFREKFLEA